MGSLVKCSIIIYDDFGNVLLAERGKKNERTWMSDLFRKIFF